MSYWIAIILVSIVVIVVIVGKKHNGADWGHNVTNILDGWLRLYCQKFHRQGKVVIPLPNEDKLIVAANHLSAIDPFLLIAAVDRPLRFMIAKEEYEKPIFNWMFKAAGCIPVDRNGRVEGAFRSALRAIEKGEIVAIFPQGGIHSIDTPRHVIKPGIIKLSQLSGCTVLPVRINGIAAPGTMLKSVLLRSDISFDVNSPISSKQVLSEFFRVGMSDWLIGKTDSVFTKESQLEVQ